MEIIILGSARCGTSVTTGILKLMGIHIDGRIGKNIHNVNGDFESSGANDINNAIFESANGTSYGKHNHWHPPSKEKINSLKGRFDKEIKEFISNKPKIWGWKNPKTTLTIEHYLPYLKNPRFVCVYRNLRDASNSASAMTGGHLLTPDFLGVHEYYYTYLDYFKKKYKNDYKFFNIHYEDIISDEPEILLDELAEFVGIEEYPITEIQDFIIKK
jgi:hypothetical protein